MCIAATFRSVLSHYIIMCNNAPLLSNELDKKILMFCVLEELIL